MPWGNYVVEDTDGLVPTVRTDAYKAYMAKLIEERPDQLPAKLDQIPKIADLDHDWSTIIKNDQQVQTVGTHWPLSRTLTKEMRTRMERTGLCMGCHREMSNAELWGKVATKGQLTDEQRIELINEMLKAFGDSVKK